MSPIEMERTCTRCRLSETRTNVVPGSGDPRARLVLIGEAPGRDEDIRAVPFIGKAGRVLDEALAAAGIDRNTLYITNVVKCRPPGNRRPDEAEVSACSRHLGAELRTISPKVVCLLGQTAARHLLGEKGSMRDLVGSRRTANIHGVDVIVFIAYHPAACIYDRGKVVSLEDTLKSCAAEAMPHEVSSK